jgi:Rod binding domain-containing protein
VTQPIIGSSVLPAEVRNGTEQDKKDYKTALSFEQMLVGQLVQSMVGADGSTGADSTDSDSDDGDDTDTTPVNPLADGPYATQLQDALTSALTSGSGLGLAAQIYKEMRS